MHYGRHLFVSGSDTESSKVHLFVWRGLKTGNGRGLAVKLRLGKVQVRSGSVYSLNLILLSLTLK